MHRFFICFLWLPCIFTAIIVPAQGIKFITPIGGTYLKDFFAVNYPDQDNSNGIKDPYCGTKTYNGHLGTDLVIRGFTQMDSLVPVYAAAAGSVFVTRDSMYDRNKDSNSLGFGNYIGINHKDSLYTYYAHLKKFSQKVKKGDSVKQGQLIGYVGSSGFALSPHLHFEVWSNGGLVDPWKGGCGSNTSLWMNQLPYDTGFRVIESGFVPYIATVDSLEERIGIKNYFSTMNDSVICYWALLSGLHPGDSLKTIWKNTPTAATEIYSYQVKTTEWFYYYWTYIDIPASPGGLSDWTAKLYLNGKEVNSKPFQVSVADAIETAKKNTGGYQVIKQACGWMVTFSKPVPKASKNLLTDGLGRAIGFTQETAGNIMYIKPEKITPGVYFLSLNDNGTAVSVRLIW